MRKPLRLLAIVLTLAGTSGCVKTPDDLTPPSSAIPQPKPNSDSVKMTQGGQPGSVQISGALVTEIDSKSHLNEEVSVVTRGGIGISGAEASVDGSHQPGLSSILDAKSLFKVPSDHSVIVVGCSQETIGHYSKGLNIKQPIENKDDLTVHIDASTVVLCGKIDFEIQFVAVNADRLILIDLDYSQRGIMNVTRFSSNWLTLIGANKITSKAQDLDNTMFDGPMLVLEVAQKFQPEQKSKLEIFSTGSNYLARK